VSIPVELNELPAQISQLGSRALLVTSSSDGPPHVSSVIVTFENDNLAMRVGRKTRVNLTANRAATLVWPEVDGEHCLIVDGIAPEAAADPLLVRPTSAILHRLAQAAS
jgi:hypothetical protein